MICCSVKRAFVRVRRVGAGLCKQGGINKEPFINPFLLETVPAGAGLSVETLAGNYFFQGSATCAVPGHMLPDFQTQESLHCPRKGEGSRQTQTFSLRPQVTQGPCLGFTEALEGPGAALPSGWAASVLSQPAARSSAASSSRSLAEAWRAATHAALSS